MTTITDTGAGSVGVGSEICSISTRPSNQGHGNRSAGRRPGAQPDPLRTLHDNTEERTVAYSQI